MKTMIRNGKEYIAVPGNCYENLCPFSSPFDECGISCDLSLDKEHWEQKTDEIDIP